MKVECRQLPFSGGGDVIVFRPLDKEKKENEGHGWLGKMIKNKKYESSGACSNQSFLLIVAIPDRVVGIR